MILTGITSPKECEDFVKELDILLEKTLVKK
jgi:hypothetical protein